METSTGKRPSRRGRPLRSACLRLLVTSLSVDGTIDKRDQMSSQVASPNTEAAILARLIQIGQEELSRGAAEYLLSIRFDDRDTARMNELSEVARQGKLTREEQAELDSYLQFGNLLAVLQSKARRALQRSAQ